MPYILNTEKNIKDMLKTIGVGSIDELYSLLPDRIKLNNSLEIPSGLSEFSTKKAITNLSKKNNTLSSFNSFLGAGCYDHYIPQALEHILLSPQFLTAYTPYQAECSQGILQAIYEYQSYMCILTGMDASNASLLDGASALAEAVLMSLRITKRKKVFISKTLHPEYKETLKTYLSGFNFIIEEIGIDNEGTIDIHALMLVLNEKAACFAFQSPNFLGLVEQSDKISGLLKEKNALSVMVTNPLSLAILKEPALLGVDIVCGDGQPFGGGLNFGGPTFGFLATKKDYLRELPGRIVGKTTDKDGNIAFCLTLQTREQHIRREKATSNICSNQSLNAIGAAVYLALVGTEGLKNVALCSFYNAQYLYERMKELRGVHLPYSYKIFNELVWNVDNYKDVIKKLFDKGIIAGYPLEDRIPFCKDSILSCCTEKKSKEDIDNFIYALAEVLRG